VVQITVDQLRADLLPRYRARFGHDGFARFLEHGAYFPVARYAHAATETAVGHATLFTGALPSSHGIVGNEWFDPIRARPRYSVEDAREKTLTPGGARDGGASPRNLRVTTIGDELVLASGGRSLVYAISSKDRAAVLPAGHAGKAVWLDDESGSIVTSSYYGDAIPAWASAAAAPYARESLARLRWDLRDAPGQYLARVPDAREAELPPSGMHDTFPHDLGEVPAADRIKAFRRTPFADDLSVALAAGLLAEEPLGRDEMPDLLSVSFSATDAIAHAFGPESLEYEDQLIRLDAAIGRLFSAVRARIPDEQVLYVLCSDHGGPETPAHLRALGLPAGKHDSAAIVSDLNAALEQTYGAGAAFVQAFTNPALWLDETAISQRGLHVSDVAERVRNLVRTLPGVMRAYTRDQLATGEVAGDPIDQRVLASFDAERTGHVYLVPDTGWLLATESGSLASMHGTPHRYDTDVPLAFYGAGIRAGVHARIADPRDIASTLAVLLGVKAPSGASGVPLPEVLAALPPPK
jgi:arylsulfatase A-like enzyme